MASLPMRILPEESETENAPFLLNSESNTGKLEWKMKEGN